MWTVSKLSYSIEVVLFPEPSPKPYRMRILHRDSGEPASRPKRFASMVAAFEAGLDTVEALREKHTLLTNLTSIISMRTFF